MKASEMQNFEIFWWPPTLQDFGLDQIFDKFVSLMQAMNKISPLHHNIVETTYSRSFDTFSKILDVLFPQILTSEACKVLSGSQNSQQMAGLASPASY